MLFFGIDHRILARICKVSYNYPENRAEELRMLVNGDFNVLEEFSDKDIFTLQTQGKVIVAFRGTELSKGNIRAGLDLYNDINLAIGKEDRVFRLTQGREMLLKIRSRYPSVLITGHSLGGYVGMKLALEYNLDAVLFNIGSSPLDKKGIQTSNKIIHITTNNLMTIPPIVDILSVSALFIYRFPYYIEKVGAGLSNHTILNFI
jgi:hypothetical protein